MLDMFQPSLAGLPHATRRESALAKIDAVHLAQYARTRNSLDGCVSRLSPYLTHGITDVPEVIAQLAGRTNIGWQDKFSFELGWREYFHHVWRVLGKEIWRNQRPPPAEGLVGYALEMPQDIVGATTGVAIIDAQIRTLYSTGYVHNHARMWIASYVVHIRKVDWRVGARWMYGHLLDGDLASNTLSWQWVAGTWTGKPYLFNAENVAKYAPGFDHSETAIDCTYGTLEQIARQRPAMPEAPQKRAQLSAVVPPALVTPAQIAVIAHERGLAVVDSLPANFVGTLLHPWALRWPARDQNRMQTISPAIGLIVPEFHDAFPWSAQRWNFVLQAMRECCDQVWIVGEASKPALGTICVRHTLNPHYSAFIEACVALGATSTASPRAFIDPDKLHRSFSSFWHLASKQKFPQ
jgi:deoxyribodipyrimidine photo-lyase